MIDVADISGQVARIEGLMAQKLALRRGDLATRARRAGRRLPGGVQRDIARIVAAAQLAGHPKMRLQVDDTAVRAAVARVEAHLKAIDVADRRKGKILGALGGLAFNLILFALLLGLFLRWRGFL